MTQFFKLKTIRTKNQTYNKMEIIMMVITNLMSQIIKNNKIKYKKILINRIHLKKLYNKNNLNKKNK